MTPDLDTYLQNRWSRLGDKAKTLINLERDPGLRAFATAQWTKQYYEEQLSQLEREEDGVMVRIVIEVKGGCVQAVTASDTVEVLVDDHDASELGPTCLDVNPTYVENVFTEYEDAHGNNPVLS